MKEVKVAIIGAGSAGLSARREVAKKTDDYVVIDGGILGTTCARVGCMPSKVLIQVAEDYNRRHKFEQVGIHGSESLSLDSKQVMLHVRKLRDRFVRAVTGDMQDWVEEKLIRKYARFESPHVLDLGDEKIKAEKIIVATGSKPKNHPLFKDYPEFVITTDEFFEIEQLPEKVAVLGLGVIGIELGQALSRLDVDVIGIARRKNIAGITDPELNDYVTSKFSEQMNLSFKGLDKVEKQGNQLKLTTGGKDYLVDKVLVTTGREINYKSLNIDILNVKFNKKGVPEFAADTFSLKEYPHIYLAGDNTGRAQILHEASDEGRIVGYNAVNGHRAFKMRSPLFITFSDPNICSVGKMYQDLIDEGIEFEVGQVSFEGQGRSIVKLKEIGMLRVYGEKSSGKLLGAELMAPDGEHLAHLLSWAIAQDLTVNHILAMPFYHPVIEEGLRTALRDLRGKVDEAIPPLELVKEKIW